jgi:hypothetical protein
VNGRVIEIQVLDPFLLCGLCVQQFQDSFLIGFVSIRLTKQSLGESY